MASKEGIEIGLAGGAFHRSLPRDRHCSARRGVGETPGRSQVAQPATDEGGPETVAGARWIDLFDLEPGLREARRGVEVAGAIGAALVNDRPNAAAEDFRDCGLLFLRLRKEIEFDAAWQEKIATLEQRFASFSLTIRQVFGRLLAKKSKRRWTGWAIGRICSR